MKIKRFMIWLIIKLRLLRIIGADEQSYKSKYLYYKYKDKFRNLKTRVNVQRKIVDAKLINVWVYWQQGINNAPPIIKACIGSIKRHFNNPKYNVVVIDNTNIDKYITLPPFISEKFKKNKISIQHYSDIIRTYLLVTYGGYWIDSTVFISHRNELFDLIEKQNLFVFKKIDLSRKYLDKTLMSSWFMYSKQNEPILFRTLQFLYRYWEINNKLEHYFVYHIMFAISADENQQEFKNIPTYNNCSPHILQFEMFNNFDEDRYNQILKMSPIHKLNRSEKPKSAPPRTFADYVLNSLVWPNK